MKKTASRLLAGVVAASLVTTFSPIATPIAGAQPAAANPASIDPNEPVELRVHKFIGDLVRPTGTGAPGPNYGGTLTTDAVEFTATRINAADGTPLDLTDPADLTDLGTLDATNIDPARRGDVFTTTTNAGIATFSDATTPGFNQGVYLIEETNRDGFTSTRPFLVTLPFAGNAGNWDYEQDVYPKNQEIDANKSVDSTDARPGGSVAYEIDAPIPDGPKDRFNIVDELLTNNNGPVIEYRDGTATVRVVTSAALNTVPAGWTEVAGQPNTYEVDAAQYNSGAIWDAGTNTLRIEFNEDGLDALSEARAENSDAVVRVNFTADITQNFAGESITNTAVIELPWGATADTNLPADPNDPAATPTPTTTNFADLYLLKEGNYNQNTPIPTTGAVFEIYECTQQNAGDPWVINGDRIQLQGAAGSTNDADFQFTTAGDATDANLADAVTAANQAAPAADVVNEFAVIADRTYSVGHVASLRHSSVSTTPAAGAVAPSFCALEIDAPAGYARNPQPQPIEYDPATDRYTVKVVNERDTILGQLPATGAFGLLILFLIGLAFIARGIYTSMRDGRVTA